MGARHARRTAARPLVVLLVLGSLAGCGPSYPSEDEHGQADARAGGQRVDPSFDKSAGQSDAGDEINWFSADRKAEHSDARPQRADNPAPVQTPSARRGGRTPREVVELYARAFSNWTWRDVARTNERVLARLSAGELRDAVRANAQSMRDDPTLERDRLANRGELKAIDIQRSDPGRSTVWAVLRETASAQGRSALSDMRIAVYRATAELLDDDRWYVTAFEPQG